MATKKQLEALAKAREARAKKATKKYNKTTTTSKKTRKPKMTALGAITMEKAKDTIGGVLREVNSIYGELSRGYQSGKSLNEIYTLGELIQTIEGLKMQINGVYFSM